MMDTRYLIIGNSAGGIGAAEAVRRTDADGTITIVSDEPYPAYSRPMISEYLAHHIPIERMLYRPAGFYETNRINTLLGKKAVRLDLGKKTVTLDSGESVSWEKLLLATGGTPIVTQTEGVEREGVFTFTTLDNAKAIDRFLNERSGAGVRAVVIGGGLIGLSVGEALSKRSVAVTIVEMKDRVLNTIVDEETSALAAAAIKKAGVSVVVNHTVARITSYDGTGGPVTGVTLDDGQPLPCEIVIMAIGVRPRLDLVTGSGLKVNRGVLVDRTMATSHPDVYACGDVSEAFDFVYDSNRLSPVWPNAYTGGRVAGLNMAGAVTDYAGGTAMNSLTYFGVAIASAGIAVAPDASYETVSRRQGQTYRKIVLKDGQITGMVFVGDIEKAGVVFGLMKDGIDVTAFRERLVAGDFSLAMLPDNVWRERIGLNATIRPAAREEDAGEPAEEAVAGE